jgi:hypothetical protein
LIIQALAWKQHNKHEKKTLNEKDPRTMRVHFYADQCE